MLLTQSVTSSMLPSALAEIPIMPTSNGPQPTDDLPPPSIQPIAAPAAPPPPPPPPGKGAKKAKIKNQIVAKAWDVLQTEIREQIRQSEGMKPKLIEKFTTRYITAFKQLVLFVTKIVTPLGDQISSQS